MWAIMTRWWGFMGKPPLSPSNRGGTRFGIPDGAWVFDVEKGNGKMVGLPLAFSEEVGIGSVFSLWGREFYNVQINHVMNI